MEPANEPQLTVIGRAYIPLNCSEAGGCERKLRLWNNSEEHDLWIDKYDVRRLCGQYSDFKLDRAADVEVEEIDEGDIDMDYRELMYERYQDMLDVKECDLMSLSKSSFTPRGEAGGGLSDAVTAAATATNAYAHYDATTVCSDPFNMPAISFPPNVKHFPDTMTQYNVILHTAHAVRENPQLEILLKVKQKLNPKFYFLEDDLNSRCNLYPLYKYFRDLDDKKFWRLLLGKISPSDADVDRVVDDPGGTNALSLLGEYSDSDSNGDCEQEEACDSQHTRHEQFVQGEGGEGGAADKAEESSRTSVCTSLPDMPEHENVGTCEESSSLLKGDIDVTLVEQERIGESNDDNCDYDFDSDCNVTISDSDLLLDSDIDETLKCFWTRRSRLLKERKAFHERKKLQSKRLRKAKLFTERLSVAAISSRCSPVSDEENSVSSMHDTVSIVGPENGRNSRQCRERMDNHPDNLSPANYKRKRNTSNDCEGVMSGRGSISRRKSGTVCRSRSRSKEQDVDWDLRRGEGTRPKRKRRESEVANKEWDSDREGAVTCARRRLGSYRMACAFPVKTSLPVVAIDGAAVQRKIRVLLQG